MYEGETGDGRGTDETQPSSLGGGASNCKVFNFC